MCTAHGEWTGFTALLGSGTASHWESFSQQRRGQLYGSNIVTSHTCIHMWTLDLNMGNKKNMGTLGGEGQQERWDRETSMGEMTKVP